MQYLVKRLAGFRTLRVAVECEARYFDGQRILTMELINQFKKSVVRWLEDNRGLVVLFFCLPASFFFDLVLRLRVWLQRALTNVPETHQLRVIEIQKQVCIH